MHLRDDDLAMLVDASLSPEAAGRLARHVQECAECARRFAAHRESVAGLALALRALDHAPPPVRVGAVIALARSRRRRRVPAAAAAAVLLCVATAVAAAAPQSPLRRYLERLFATRAAPAALATATPVTIPPSGAQDARATSGISFSPGRDAVLVFRKPLREGVLRIRLIDGPDVTITGTGGEKRFVLTGDGVTIDNTAGSSAFEIAIPSRVPHASVRVGEHLVFVKSGMDITSDGQRDSTGVFVISFTPLQRRVP